MIIIQETNVNFEIQTKLDLNELSSPERHVGVEV